MAHILAHQPMQSPAPEPGTFYLQFQRELAASDQITSLARILFHVHWLYEGWGQVPPLTGELARIYRKAAAFAVRFCSEPCRQVAVSRAEAYAVARWDGLERTLRSCDTTPAVREAAIKGLARDCIEIYRHALMVGDGRSTLETAEFERQEVEAGDEG